MAKQMKRHKIGSLDCIDFDDPKVPATRVLILLHGYAANSDDLAGLASVIRVPGLRIIFPNGPFTVQLGPHMEGRAWFPIALSELEKGVNFETIIPPGIKKSREAVIELIDRLGLAPSQIAIGGFSQGAMLATEVALQMKEQVAALVVLSGALVSKENWTQKLVQHQGLAFFQSHGEGDQVLPVNAAKNLHQLLISGGAKGQIHLFRGGHEIPLEIITRLEGFLSQIFLKK